MAEHTNGANGHANGKVSYAERHNLADHFIGGNRLDNAPASKVKDFVAQNDGHTVITNVSPSVYNLRPSPALPFCTPALGLDPASRAVQPNHEWAVNEPS